MSRLIFTILFFLAFVAAGYLAFRLLYNLITNFQPNSKKIKLDWEAFRKELNPWVSTLVPWNPEEIELLSFNQIHQSLTTGVITTMKGVFTSIYNEPMFAYAYKGYYSASKNAILYARTSHHEFFYRIREKEIKLHIDNEYIGIIRPGGSLYSARTDRLIGRINKEQNIMPIILGEKEQGILLEVDEAMKINSRAFQFVNAMKEEEEVAFLSLAILEMIEKELPQKS